MANELKEELSDLLRDVPDWENSQHLAPTIAISISDSRARAALEEAKNTAFWHPKRAGLAHIWNPVRAQIADVAKTKGVSTGTKKALTTALRAVDRWHPETTTKRAGKAEKISADTADFLRSVLKVDDDADAAAYGHGLNNYSHVQAMLGRVANGPRHFEAIKSGFVKSSNRKPYYALTPKGVAALQAFR